MVVSSVRVCKCSQGVGVEWNSWGGEGVIKRDVSGIKESKGDRRGKAFSYR